MFGVNERRYIATAFSGNSAEIMTALNRAVANRFPQKTAGRHFFFSGGNVTSIFIFVRANNEMQICRQKMRAVSGEGRKEIGAFASALIGTEIMHILKNRFVLFAGPFFFYCAGEFN